MKHQECSRHSYAYAFLSLLLVAVLAFSGCKNAEASKAEHLKRGDQFLKEKKFQEASIEFRNAIQIDDKLAAAHWGLAQAYEGLQRYAEAVQEIQRTIDLDPNHLDSRVRLGNYYMIGRQPNIAEAERLAKEVLAKDPNFIEGHILMATVLYAQDKAHPERALAELNRAIEIDPKRVESYLSLARFYTTINDGKKAEETLKRAVDVNPSSALAHAEYGRFLVAQNRAGEAESEFKKAVEVEPASREPRMALGSFYIINKQLDKAEEVYKALAEMETGALCSQISTRPSIARTTPSASIRRFSRSRPITRAAATVSVKSCSVAATRRARPLRSLKS
jgi:Tfp pilus assembly protein PilF